jgi:hypothetical protein
MIEKTAAGAETAAKRSANFVRTGYRLLIIKTCPASENV